MNLGGREKKLGVFECTTPAFCPDRLKKSQVMSIRTTGIQSKQASAGNNKCQWLITGPQLSKSSGFISVTCDYLFIYLFTQLGKSAFINRVDGGRIKHQYEALQYLY